MCQSGERKELDVHFRKGCSGFELEMRFPEDRFELKSHSLGAGAAFQVLRERLQRRPAILDRFLRVGNRGFDRGSFRRCCGFEFCKARQLFVQELLERFDLLADWSLRS